KSEESESPETKRFQRRYLTTQWLLVAITLLYSVFSIAQWHESELAVEAMNRANQLADESSETTRQVVEANKTLADAAKESVAQSKRLADATQAANDLVKVNSASNARIADAAAEREERLFRAAHRARLGSVTILGGLGLRPNTPYEVRAVF